MALKFIEKREITNVSQLTNVQIKQLEQAGLKLDGVHLSAEIRLKKLEEQKYKNKEQANLPSHCYHWKVTDFNDRYLYDAWLYMVDNRTFFNANTTETIGL
mgnify:CR=1 FL=1